MFTVELIVGYLKFVDDMFVFVRYRLELFIDFFFFFKLSFLEI